MLLLEEREVSVPIPPLPNFSVPKSSPEPMLTKPSLSLAPPDAENSEEGIRKHDRHNKRLRVHLECGGRSFKTYSVNISVGGMLLEDPLPDWVAGYCTVKLINPQIKQAVELTCSIVENQEPHLRFRVMFLPLKGHESEDKFEQWIIAA